MARTKPYLGWRHVHQRPRTPPSVKCRRQRRERRELRLTSRQGLRRSAWSRARAAAALLPAGRSPMLQLLSRDAGAQFTLLQLLTQSELAALHSSSRSTRAWLESSAGLPASFAARVRVADVAWMLSCGWAKRRVTHIQLQGDVVLREYDTEPESESESDDDAGETVPDKLAGLEWRMWRQALNGLCLFPRLRGLELLVDTVVDVGEDAIVACFASLARRLVSLHIRTRKRADSQPSLMRDCLNHLPALTQLEEFRVLGLQEEEVLSQIDLSSLPKLPRLHFVQLGAQSDDFECTPQQAAALIQCPQLTSVDAPCPVDAVEALLRQRLRLSDGGAASSAASAASSLADAAEPAPLRCLNLRAVAMTPALWSSVSQLTLLESLQPRAWSADIDEAQWQLLARMQRLHTLTVANEVNLYVRSDDEDDESNEESLLVARCWPAILQLRSLTSLCLCRARISTQQLQQLADGLPFLSRLELWHMRVESLQPLQDAPSLRTLWLTYCSDSDRQSLRERITLPPLGSLIELRMHEFHEWQQRAQDAAPLTAALLQHCPLLTEDRFYQSLSDVRNLEERADAEEDDDDDDRLVLRGRSASGDSDDEQEQEDEEKQQETGVASTKADGGEDAEDEEAEHDDEEGHEEDGGVDQEEDEDEEEADDDDEEKQQEAGNVAIAAAVGKRG